jgi:hypothetical protein
MLTLSYFEFNLQKKYDVEEAPPQSYQSVGLVIGVTGIIGNSLAEILHLILYGHKK